MTADVSLRCRCGAVLGKAERVSAQAGNRIVCYCDDCQAFARFLGRSDILDPFGGTDVYQMAQARLKLTQGLKQLRCMRLSEKGPLRWYTACCNTPVGNTLAVKWVGVVGVPHCFMDHAANGVSRERALGPASGLQARFAVGGKPKGAHTWFSLAVLYKTLRVTLKASLLSRGHPSPFFEPKSGKLVTAPRVLGTAAREALRTSRPQ